MKIVPGEAMEYWIIGFGKVGRRALERLRQRSPEAAFTVVDPLCPQAREDATGISWHAVDGVSFLLRRLSAEPTGQPWIIPALPRHLAYEWMAATLRESADLHPCPVPEAVMAQVPNAIRGAEGQVFMSIADFVCPISCSEPRKGCPQIRKPRPFNLCAHLGAIRMENWRSVVVRSYQLAPGVGGYRARQLREALHTVRAYSGRFLLSTASKCHGVMHAFRIEG